jgi:CRP/FNR family transcriptional regulator, cyclic AMP receptor protein
MRPLRKTIPSHTNGNQSKEINELESSRSSKMPALLVPRPDTCPVLFQRFKEAGRKMSYAKGSILFWQGAVPTGIFRLHEGAVKMSIASCEGKTLVLGYFGPGTILGLTAAILSETSQATVEAAEPTTAMLLPRNPLQQFLRESSDAALEAARLVGGEYRDILGRLKTFCLAQSAEQRLAAFLFGMRAHKENDGTFIRLPRVTHESIAQMVGVSRETVSRLFSGLSKRRILDWKRSGIVVRDWNSLERLAVLHSCRPR